MSERPQLNHHETQDKTTRILNGQETAVLVENLSKQCSPMLAEHLVESNIVLTLAGLKPQTEFFIDLASKDDFEQIKKDVDSLNDWFIQQNLPITFIAKEEFIFDKDKKMFCMLGVINIVGLEVFSKNSHIAGVEPFDSMGGLQGYHDWFKKTEAALKAAQDSGKIPTDVDLEIILSGIARGYPDQAIWDFERALREGRMDELVDSHIANVGTYGEAQPNYDFFPEHINNPEIIENIRQAGEILEKFYGSDWHKGLKKMKKEFQKFWISQAVVLIKDDKCLLVKSAKSGLYGLPGGRIDANEEKGEALIRELSEEIGITQFKNLGLVDYLIFYDLPSGIKLEQPVCAIINLISSDQNVTNKDGQETSEIIWINESEVGNYKYCWYNLDKSIKKAFEYYRLLNK